MEILRTELHHQYSDFGLRTHVAKKANLIYIRNPVSDDITDMTSCNMRSHEPPHEPSPPRQTEALSAAAVITKTMMAHTVTYFLVGLSAYAVFDYQQTLTDPALAAMMRPPDHPLVQAGVLFQPLRGALIGVPFYLLRRPIFAPRRGWLVAWATLVIVGIIGTFAPAGGSIEGLIYTQPALSAVWGGFVEVLLQSLLLSLLSWVWVRTPRKRWLNRTMIGSFVLALLLPALGLLGRLATES